MLAYKQIRNLFEFIKKEKIEILFDKPLKTQQANDTNSIFQKHYPVHYQTINNIIGNNLFPKYSTKPKIMVDCTLGTAGHAQQLLKKYSQLYMYYY